MQDSSYQQPEHSHNEAWLTILVRYAWSHRGIGVSIGMALALLAADVAFWGSFLLSFTICPIWIFVSILKSSIQRPGWGLALVRAAIPALTLGLVLGNNVFQQQTAKANAASIVAACQEFHAANGKFPETLDELVPRYLPSVPRAKHCLVFGEFLYIDRGGDAPVVMWYTIPVFGKNFYDFENRRWRYID
jgi:hypothetical protein